MAQQHDSNTIMADTSAKKARPALEEKLAALVFVKKLGMKPAARALKIPLTTLKRWRKKASPMQRTADLPQIDPTERRNLTGQGVRSSIKQEYVDELIVFIDEQRENEIKVTGPMLAAKLVRIDASFANVEQKALCRRILNALRRRGITLRRQS
jgi:hypothetical protein